MSEQRDDGGTWPKCKKCHDQGWSGSHCVCKPKEEPMTIELPCICHVPPPEGTVRIEIRKPKEGEWFWSDDANEWMKAELDFENLGLPVAIIAPQYIYPTPVEACRMIADNGGPIECESEDAGIKALLTHVAISHTDYPFRIDWTEHGYSCYRWVSKIRIPKPNQ